MPTAPWHALQTALLDYIRDRPPEEALKLDPSGDYLVDTCFIDNDEINITDLAKVLAKALTITVD